MASSASSASQMEWEPEVPGGWPGTTRISRKRTASVAGLKEIPAGTMKEMLSDAASEQLHGTSTFGKLAVVLMAVAAITYNLFVVGGMMTFKAAQRSLRSATQYRQTVIEVRRFTGDGFESVKRRATNTVRHRDPSPQELARTRGQVRGTSPWKNRMGKAQQNIQSPPHTEAYRTNVSSMLSVADDTSFHDETSKHTVIPKEASSHITISNEILDNPPKLQDRPQPRVSIGGQSQARMAFDQLQPERSSSRAGAPGLSFGADAAAVAALRPSLVRGLDTPSMVRKPQAFTHRKPILIEKTGPAFRFNKNRLQPVETTFSVSKVGNRNPFLHDRIPGWKKPIQHIRINRSTRSPTRMIVTGAPSRVSHGVPLVAPLPEIPISSFQQILAKPNQYENERQSIYDFQDVIDNSIEMTEAPTDTGEALTAKQVKIALDPRNGLPREYVAKFFKASYCGDWEPSSPWDSERVGHTELDLKGHLNSLKNDSFNSPVRPYTPVRKIASRYPESIVPGQDPDFILGPNKVFTPPNIETQQSSVNLAQTEGPAIGEYVTAATTTRNLAIDSSNTDANMTAQNPLTKSTAVSNLLPNSAPEVLESPVRTSPIYRVVERVMNGVRKAVFLSPSSRRVYHDATPILSQSSDVQEAVDTSIEMTDASPLAELTSPTLVLSPPSIIDLEAIHDVGESPYGIGGTSSDLSQPLDDTLDKTFKTEDPNTRQVMPQAGLNAVDSKDGSKHDNVSGNASSAGIGTASEAGPATTRDDVFFDLTMAEAMSQLGVSDKMSKKMKKKKAAKEAARAKEQEEKEAKAKAEREAAEAKARAEAEEAAKKSRSQRRLPNQKLVKPLSRDWEEKIDAAMNQGGTLTTTSNGTDLTRHDLMSVLGDRKWLNDEIINGYIDWVVDYANKKAAKGPNGTPKVVAQNSFFYDKLSKEGPSSVSRWMRRKKAAGAKLLEVEIVLIPVNNAAHWTLIVVSPKARTIEYLDSFGGAGAIMVANTKAWLKVELGNLWREDEWTVLDTESASQDNGYDCGVFVTTNAECVVGGISTSSYSGEDMTNQRRRIAGVLLNKGFSKDFIPAEEL